jgi:hypothetical protein
MVAEPAMSVLTSATAAILSATVIAVYLLGALSAWMIP